MGNNNSTEEELETERRRRRENAEIFQKQLRELERKQAQERDKIERNIREKEEIERWRREELERELHEIRKKEEEEREERERKRRYLEPLSEPWRKIGQEDDPWTEEFKKDLISKILSVKPPESIQYLNVLLLGQAASGKTSFFNTCDTAIRNEGRLIARAMVLEKTGKSVTSTFVAIPMESKGGKILPIRLFDCRGLNIESGVPTDDIRLIVHGHVKSGYTINPVAPITEENEKYRKNPTIQHKMHCVMYVTNADNPTEQLNDTKTQEQLKYIRENLAAYHVPQFVLFNKIDRLAISNKQDLKLIFRSQNIHDKCKQAADYMEIPLMNVFPMSNYHEEQQPTLEKDILALFYLYTVMERANDLVKRVTRDNEPDDFYDEEKKNSSCMLS